MLLGGLALPGGAQAVTSATGPEFGRCLKAESPAKGAYGNSSCTVAQAEGKYEWVPGPGPKPGFTQSGGKAVFGAVGGQSVACTGYTGAGKVSDPHRVVLQRMTFTGCRLPSGAACRSGTLEEGTMELGGLQGKLGVIAKGSEPAKNKIGLELYQFDYGLECGAVDVGLTGQVVVPVKADKMLKAEKQKFSESHGKQKPAGFETEAHHLEMSFTPGYEEAGLGLKLSQSDEEAIEVNAVV
ncbi:MAG: hypothetical protein ACYDC2_05135 [Solirubrobacteraceae bacterium]